MCAEIGPKVQVRMATWRQSKEGSWGYRLGEWTDYEPLDAISEMTTALIAGESFQLRIKAPK